MICKAKHTDYQPTENKWRCPACGAGSEAFWIEEAAEYANDDCELLHAEDSVRCASCQSVFTGSALVKKLKKEDCVVTCPC